MDEFVLVPKSIKVSNNMKARFIGEFTFEEPDAVCDEDGVVEELMATRTVPWDLCKRIFKEMTAAWIEEMTVSPLKAYALYSTDYVGLWDFICAGGQALGFVDYRFLDEASDAPPYRDPVVIRRRGPYQIDICARGISYGSVHPFEKARHPDEKALFLKSCRNINLAWAKTVHSKELAQRLRIQVCNLGITGRHYDAPQETRAYTYKDQPDNMVASILGGVAMGSLAGCGDGIDLGLRLLRNLQEAGFGVFELPKDGTSLPQQAGRPMWTATMPDRRKAAAPPAQPEEKAGATICHECGNAGTVQGLHGMRPCTTCKGQK